ncbi:AAA family ATPase [Lichenicoccus sp.]|uniref:ATP-binding protein n=1 Tax=Lichenicoccus sp. TaxID=2781899 RepID=UPI003D0CED39
MRLVRLDLLRYGHLSDASLRFNGPAALHVVLGPNEAGKSTALAAIADALFGFGHRTDFDFLHGSAQLRIGVTLAAGDGDAAAFVRRKGRRDTLRDEADQPLPEEALRRFLGGVDRERFERGFGLDGARLRQGGQDLLRSGGEAGESLLAGSGVAHLRPALARLDEEAKSLFGDGRGRRLLSEAVETWRQAVRESEVRAVAPKAWQETEAAYARVQNELADLQAQTRALAAEGSKLQRVRRTAPLLSGLDAARAASADLADAPLLAPDAEQRLDALSAHAREAARDAEREAAELRRLVALGAALPADEAALSMQDAIDRLVARRQVAEGAAGDLPEVHAAIVGHCARVSEALADLGARHGPKVARDSVPGAANRRRVQQLVSRHAALSATAAAADRASAAARLQRERAEAALLQAPPPPSPVPLRRSIERVRGEGPLDAELARARRAAADASACVVSALAALPLWTGSLAELLASPLPLPAETAAAATRLDAAFAATEQARLAAMALDTEVAALQDELARLSTGEAMPTPAAVTQARLRRDQAWRQFRQQHAQSSADAFEALRDEADRLADRRADEVLRVSAHLAATARLELLLRERVPGAGQAVADAGAGLEAAQAAWSALWAAAGLLPEAPAAMVEWRRARDDVVRRAAAGTDAAEALATLRERWDRASAMLPGGQPGESLAAQLLRAETACEAAERAESAHRACAEALAGATARLADLADEAASAEAALADWRGSWGSAVEGLGLGPDADVETMESVLGAWGRIAEVAPAWRADEQRVIDMTASLADFSNEAQALRSALGEPAGEETASLLAARLGRRLAQARAAQAEASALAERIGRHEAAAIEARHRLAACEAELAALRQACGAQDDAGVRRAIERARQRDAARAEIARLAAALLAQGDGLAEALLRVEALSVDVDSAAARLAEIEPAMQALGEQREAASAARARAEASLAAMRTGHDAAGRAQEAADALAQARAHAERYGRLRVAQVLLRAGIERFRAQQQGPLLRAAGAHFARLTGGRYGGLSVDEDAAGRALLRAIRDNGAECPVEALSEGARDQLYLALRVAAIEAHAARAQPMPFIADDLLVHFDDTRARAALALLAALGATTQVILFTHHAHIASLASELAGVSVQTLAA